MYKNILNMQNEAIFKYINNILHTCGYRDIQIA